MEIVVSEVLVWQPLPGWYNSGERLVVHGVGKRQEEGRCKSTVRDGAEENPAGARRGHSEAEGCSASQSQEGNKKKEGLMSR